MSTKEVTELLQQHHPVCSPCHEAIKWRAIPLSSSLELMQRCRKTSTRISDAPEMVWQERDQVSGANQDSGRNKDEDTELLYLTHLEKFNRKGHLDFNKFYYKFNRFMTILLGAYVCNIDLMGGHERCKGGESWSRGVSYGDRPGDEQQQQEEIRLHGNNNNDASGNEQRAWWGRFIDRWHHNLKPIQRSSWRRKLRMGWISYAILVVYFVTTSIMILDVIELYEYHIDSFRVERVRKLIAAHGPDKKVVFKEELVGAHYLMALQQDSESSSGGGNHNESFLLSESKSSLSLAEFEQALWVRMNETRHTLSYLGDRFINWSIVIENLLLANIIAGFVIYFVDTMIYLWFNQADVQHFRDHLDIWDERRRVDACCESELLKYFESNRIHALRLLAHESVLSDVPGCCHFSLELPMGQWRGRQSLASNEHEHRGFHSGKPTASPTEQQVTIRSFYWRRECKSNHTAHRLLMQMFTRGALRPITRSNLWIERRNRIEFTLRCIIGSYCIVADICSLYPIYKKSEGGFDLGGACFIINLQLINGAVNHYIVSLFLYCLDQAAQVDHVSSLIYKCIRRNEFLFYTRAISGQVSGGSISIRRMNANYLFVLMSYKIFVAQLGPYKRTLRGFFLVAFSVAFVFPVLARIHVPYLELNSDLGFKPRQLRVTGFIISAVILLPINMLCLPLCYINARCQKLYKALSSLMAHTTEVRRHSTGMAIYNAHAVTILAKELSSSKLMLEQFVVQCVGLSTITLRGSFQTLLVLHFWWGLVALSILIDARADQKLFGSLFSDPLGVWCFHVQHSE